MPPGCRSNQEFYGAFQLIDLTGAALSTTLLLLAVPALWLHRLAAVGLLVAASIAGLLENRLEVAGALALSGFAALAILSHHKRAGWPGWTTWTALLVAAAALYLHEVPGFPAWVAMGPVQIGDGAPFEKWLSFDKTGAGMLLIAFVMHGVLGRGGSLQDIRRVVPILVMTPALVSTAAVATSYVAWDLTFVSAFFWWGTLNALTTCMSEEALFRGVFQGRLVEASVRRGYSAHPAILLTAFLFGVAHLAGGPLYVLLAALAGAGYGYAYHVTQRIEAAILCHFLVNAVHFLFLTYPYPA